MWSKYTEFGVLEKEKLGLLNSKNLSKYFISLTWKLQLRYWKLVWSKYTEFGFLEKEKLGGWKFVHKLM